MTEINEEGPRAAATGRTPLSHAERHAWVRLIRSDQIGPATFAALLQRYGSASEALNALPRLARRAGRTRGIAIASEAAIDEEFERVVRFGARLVALPDPEYPARLAALEAPPPVITVLGETEFLARPAIAMVGARNASAIAMRFARELARDLGQADLTVVSGLARGIDAAAHHGSLGTGTVAVLAGGVDNIYPPDNKELYARIREQGAIVSEMPMGFAPLAQHFPRRNRIISGLAQGVVVVEAAMNSGSLITARFAAEQGREVFAVPGSPLDPRCKGTNNLIRDGATLTETVNDILPVLAAQRRIPMHPPPLVREPAPPEEFDSRTLDDLRELLLERLSPTPIDADELIRELAAEPAAVQSALLELELAGRIRRQSGRKVALS